MKKMSREQLLDALRKEIETASEERLCKVVGIRPSLSNQDQGDTTNER